MATTADLNDIALFVQVVERGSLTRAADALGLPKSSVSRGLTRLEAALGVVLLHRSPRQLVLTDAGSALFERARLAVAGLEEASVLASDAGRAPSGLVRLAAPLELSGRFLAGPLADFLRQHAGIRVDVVSTAREVDLVAEGLDLALSYGLPRDASLVARSLGSINHALFAAPGYLRRRGTPARPADLVHHDCIVAPGRTPAGWTLRGEDGEHLVQVAGVVGANNYLMALELAAEGMGIAQLPAVLGWVAVQAHRLAPVLPGYGALGPALCVVSGATRQLPQRVALLRDHLIANLRPTTCNEPPAREDGPRPRAPGVARGTTGQPKGEPGLRERQPAAAAARAKPRGLRRSAPPL